MTKLLITLLLFFITAIAEIVSCYLGYLMLKQHKPLWLIVPMTITLALSLWDEGSITIRTGRVYAAYGGIYIATALIWLKFVDGVSLTHWDSIGGLVILLGATIIILQPKTLL